MTTPAIIPDASALPPVVGPAPCPFCGSEASVLLTWETNDDPRLPGWHCGCLEPDCDMNPFTKTRWKTEREAIESWNRRSNDKLRGSPSVLLDSDEDICGLCGKPGADKYAHPVHWPGEQVPDGPLVHADCEAEECRRAHAALTDKQRRDFLGTIK